MGSGQTTTPPATKPSKSKSSSGSGSSLEDPLLDPLTSSKRSEKGTRAGAMSWEAAMGKFLGGALYSALAGHLTEAKLVGYANSGVAKATSMLKAWMKDQINPSDAEIADKFHKALTATLEQLVKEAMSADGGGMAEAIGQFVDENPVKVMLAALAGAIAFVVSNQDIPAIPISAKIGPGTASLSVDLAGKTKDVLKSMDIAIEKLEAGYKWKGGEISGSYSQEMAVNSKTDKAMLKLALGQGYGGVYGSKNVLDGKETLRYGIEGGFTGDKLSIDSSLSQTVRPGLDPTTTLGLGAKYKGNALSLGGSGLVGTDGSHALSMDMGAKLSESLKLSGSAYYKNLVGTTGDRTQSMGGKLGLDYQKEKLKFGGFLGVDSLNGHVSPTAGFKLDYAF